MPLVLISRKKSTQQWTEKLGMIVLLKFNQLMMHSAISQPEPFPQPSSSLKMEKILMSGFYVSHIIFSNTPEDKLQDQNMMI